MSALLTLSVSEKISLGTKEIARRIREQLKQENPSCKFSVQKSDYSGGSSIKVALMEAPFKVIKDYSEIPEEAFFNIGSGYKPEDIKARQQERYHQLNQYTCDKEFNPKDWNNGIFLTEAGHKLFRRVVEVVNQYNYNHSDSSIDYFSVNFCLNLHIGKWNEAFKQLV